MNANAWIRCKCHSCGLLRSLCVLGVSSEGIAHSKSNRFLRDTVEDIWVTSDNRHPQEPLANRASCSLPQQPGPRLQRRSRMTMFAQPEDHAFDVGGCRDAQQIPW